MNPEKDVPSNLIITDGKITMSDGSDPAPYLREFLQKRYGIGDGEFITVAPRKNYVAVAEELLSYRELIASAKKHKWWQFWKPTVGVIHSYEWRYIFDP